MGKLLFWLALVALAMLAMKLVAIGQRKREVGRRSAEAAGTATTAPPTAGDDERRAGELAGEMMVQCVHCGVFLPASDALVEGGAGYCGAAHRDAHRARQPRR